MKFRFRRLSDKKEVTVTLPKKMYDALRHRFTVAGAKEGGQCPLCAETLRRGAQRCTACRLAKILTTRQEDCTDAPCVDEIPSLEVADAARIDVHDGCGCKGNVRVLRTFRRFLDRAAKAGARK